MAGEYDFGGHDMSTAIATLYETDFYGWIQRQVAAMRSGNLANLDLENLIEEVESMGKSEKRELESRLEVLLMHLLKWQFQPEMKGPSWHFTIEEQRERIAKHLKENPSLKSRIDSVLEEAYRFAVRLAVKETGLKKTTFPAQCPWTFEQAVDNQFWPEESTPIAQ